MLKYEKFIKAHAQVEAWLRNRPLHTRRKFAGNLKRFCEAVNVSPEEWRDLDKSRARDLTWQYIQPLIAEHSSVAAGALTALKSWFRNLNGEQLPFDSGRGGKHYFHVKYKKRATEHIPNKKEMYQIVDMASSLRDKAILLFLFQSGCRVNVLEHIKYGDIADQLDQDTITLKITGRLDHKLRGRDIPYYYTFVNGEGAETLKQYCKLKHKKGIQDKPLFYTSGKKPISQTWILRMVKTCTKRAGFNPKTLSTHTLRKSFRKIVRQTSIDDDDKEELMGHVISGSREAYYDEKDTGLIMKAYQRCNFSREIPHSETEKLKAELEESRKKHVGLEKRIELLEEFIKKAVKPA